MAGRQDEAMDLARQALELSRAFNERGHQVWALRLLGEIVAQCDPPAVEQAEVSYQQALALAKALGMPPLLAHCHLGLGTLYTRLGRQGQACPALSATIELYRAMDMTFWLSQAEATLASLRDRAG
jgi:tetratricopeptide (TPR) repeat protein